MKHLNITIGVILLVLNVILGLLISQYPTFNYCLNSGVIVLSVALIELLKCTKISDAFRISLTFFYAFMMVVCLVLGVLSPDTFKDNWYFVAIVSINFVEVIILLAVSFVSRNVKAN